MRVIFSLCVILLPSTASTQIQLAQSARGSPPAIGRDRIVAANGLPASTNKSSTKPHSIGNHLLDRVDPLDYGAVGNGTTDSGAAFAAGIAAAQARGATMAFPKTAAGYRANFTPPGFSIVSNGTITSLPGLMLGKYEFGGNRFTGTGVGSPTTGAGTFNNQYTNPFNVTSDVKWTFDPAALPQEVPVSVEGFSLECAPNRPNPLNSNPNRNWIACFYAAADTGKGGAPGTSIATGIANWVLNVDENSGTGLEFDIDSNGTGTKDGGLVRGLLIAGGGNDNNNTSNYIGLDILRSSYTGAYQPWGAGVSIHSSTVSLQLWKDIANEYGYAIQLLDSSNGNAQTFSVDKNGFVGAAGLYAQNNVSGLTVQSRARAFAALPTCSSTYEGLQAAVTDATVATWGTPVAAGGGTNHVLAYCDGTNWTVMAK
jgi:hypothetical protein